MKRLGMGLTIGLIAACAVAADGAGSATSNEQRILLGDQLVIPEQVSRSADLPQRGTSMTQVEKRWGAPDKRSAAVGNPPISRWAYEDFTVYFEYQHVIHSVQTADGG